MKKIAGSMLVVLFFWPTVAIKAEFSDVASEYPWGDAIKYVQQQGIVEGYSDGTFRPDGKINRAEFLKVLVQAAVGYPEASIAKNCFSDVKEQWFYVYVCFAKGKGWIGGFPDGSFKPEQPINFVEAAKIIVNAMIAKIAVGEPWYKPYADALYAKYAIPDTIEAFGSELTRGEMAEIIYRLKAGIKKQSKSYDELDQAGWLTYTNPAVSFVVDYPADYKMAAEKSDKVVVDTASFLTGVSFSKNSTCPPNYEGICMEKYFAVRVFKNDGGQSVVQYIDTNSRYNDWELRSEDERVDSQLAWLLYPSETELYAMRYVLGDGYQTAPLMYPYFVEIEISGGIDKKMAGKILESFKFNYESASLNSYIIITAPDWPPVSEINEYPWFIEGETSGDCTRIVVHATNAEVRVDDTYQLQNYKYGDTAFKYGVSPEWNNLGFGINVYEFVAYCDGKNVSVIKKLKYVTN